MTQSALEKEIFIEFNKDFYNSHIQILINPTVVRFRKSLKSFTLINFVFLLLILSEISYFFIHLTLLVQTFVIAIHLALIFATVFCYFTLHMYIQTRKIEKCKDLVTDFICACRQATQIPEGDPEHHFMVACACCKLAEELHGQEYHIYTLPDRLIYLHATLEKVNCWLFWYDIHLMKELLLRACIEEHITLVRMKPTDLEAHARLANAYVMLSGLYIDPRTVEGLDGERWIPLNKYNEQFRQKFRSIAERAIEEFKILNAYAPHDPWVHAQLAYSYHDLQMPMEEIQEYETILQLCPDDKETLFKLGKLYFEQGFNAKGLQLYEHLKESHHKNAETLIHFYGAYTQQN